ncbi:MAG: hypothetical protein AB3P07_05090 [Wolbachia pipientis]
MEELKVKIGHTISPNSKDVEYLSRKINEETIDKGTCNPFAFFIRDDTEQIIAGCSGFVIYGSIYTTCFGCTLIIEEKLTLPRKSREEVKTF